jgi:hypothetical protein
MLSAEPIRWREIMAPMEVFGRIEFLIFCCGMFTSRCF